MNKLFIFFLVLFVLKVIGWISWSWFWVCSPLFILVVIGIIAKYSNDIKAWLMIWAWKHRVKKIHKEQK